MIKLKNIQGIARKSGEDEFGNYYLEYNLDLEDIELDEDGNEIWDICEECGKEITEGWVCMDGGETYCRSCIEIEKEGVVNEKK